jgi:hypothetical protein
MRFLPPKAAPAPPMIERDRMMMAMLVVGHRNKAIYQPAKSSPHPAPQAPAKLGRASATMFLH